MTSAARGPSASSVALSPFPARLWASAAPSQTELHVRRARARSMKNDSASYELRYQWCGQVNAYSPRDLKKRPMSASASSILSILAFPSTKPGYLHSRSSLPVTRASTGYSLQKLARRVSQRRRSTSGSEDAQREAAATCLSLFPMQTRAGHLLLCGERAWRRSRSRMARRPTICPADLPPLYLALRRRDEMPVRAASLPHLLDG